VLSVVVEAIGITVVVAAEIVGFQLWDTGVVAAEIDLFEPSLDDLLELAGLEKTPLDSSRDDGATAVSNGLKIEGTEDPERSYKMKFL